MVLTSKAAANGRDRADIVYEVRDATGFAPSGKKAWWQELPEAGEAAWAERATRRKGRVDFRLAFVPSKFRLGAEPEPFCVELHLPKDEPWTLRDVTAGILKAADDSLSQEKQAKEERLQKAAEALALVVSGRAAKDNPMLKTEAEQFLCDAQDLRRSEARHVLKDSALWRLENRRQGAGKQAAWCLLPKNGGNGNEPGNPHEERAGDDLFVAAQAGSGRQRQVLENPAIGAVFQRAEFVAEEQCEEKPEDGNDPETTTAAWEDGNDRQPSREREPAGSWQEQRAKAIAPEDGEVIE